MSSSSVEQFDTLADVDDFFDGNEHFQDIENQLNADLAIDSDDIATVGGMTLYLLKRHLIPGWKNGQSMTHGQTLAHYAVKRPSAAAIKLIVDVHHLDIDTMDDSGCTPLMIAVISGEIQCVANLIRGGVDVNKRDSGGFTSLHLAARSGGIGVSAHDTSKFCKIMKLLIDAGANIDALDVRCCSTALHMTCKSGSTKQALLLLRSGANHSILDNEAYTALHRAVTRDENNDLVLILTAYGCLANTSNNVNSTPLHDAFSQCLHPEEMIDTLNLFDTLDMSHRDSDGNTLLHKSARFGDLLHTIMNEHNLYGQNLIDIPNFSGNTPIHHMATTRCQFGQSTPTVVLASMKLLLENGACISTANHCGMTIRDSAKLFNLRDVIAMLDTEVLAQHHQHAFNCICLRAFMRVCKYLQTLLSP
jgi:ankyrin repeat protein